MWPDLTLAPWTPTSLVLMVIAGLVALASALRSRRHSDPDRRIRALFLAYLSGAIAVSLLIHASVGDAPLVVSTYAVMLALGCLFAWWILLLRLPDAGLTRATVFVVIAGCLAFGIAGGRAAELGALLLAAEHSADTGPGLAGLGIFGAFVANGIFLSLLFGRRRDGTLERVLDAGVVAIAMNLVVGRIGCMLAGCCFGAPTTTALSFDITRFATSTPARLAHPGERVRIWATQPLEAVGVLAIAGAAELLYRRRVAWRLPPGTVFAAAAAAYGILRAVLETLRADSARSIFGMYTPWQVMAAGLFAICVLWLAARLHSRSSV